jgi:hypothetical protein
MIYNGVLIDGFGNGFSNGMNLEWIFDRIIVIGLDERRVLMFMV